MCASPLPSPDARSIEDLHVRFLALLPRIEAHARIYFRYALCRQQREDLVAEVIALAWKWYARLVRRGKDPADFVMTFAQFTARGVQAGRRVGDPEGSKDVLSRTAQRRHGFSVEPLPNATRRPFADIHGLVHGQQELDAYEDRLADNTETPPPDAAAFRIDFPAFLAGLSDRDRQMAMRLSLGHQGKVVARQFEMSPARVCQLRRRWHREWQRLQGFDTVPA
jgi:hypothetical protein